MTTHGSRKTVLSTHHSSRLNTSSSSVDEYPIDSIEDGMAENDWERLEDPSQILIGDRCQLVGR